MKKTIISLALIGLVLGSYVSSAVAGLTYAPWVHHGDTYMATGKLAGKTRQVPPRVLRFPVAVHSAHLPRLGVLQRAPRVRVRQNAKLVNPDQ